MRPSDAFIEKYDWIFEHNMGLVIESFEQLMRVSEIENLDQAVVNNLFIVFVAGMMEVLNPGSTFNKGWKAK